MAYVYPGPKNNFLGDVGGYPYKGAYVYGADAEFNCRGVGKSTANTKCTFSGASANSYIGFSGQKTTTAKTNFDTIAKAYTDSGKDVWMVVDGTVGSKYIPSWVPLTAQELTDLARAAADNACNDTNVVGLAVDFEPYAKTFDTSVSGIFYTQLDQFIKNCNKKWAVFAGGSSWIQPNWDSLGTSGYLLLSAYDIGTTCPSAAVYQAELTNLLNVVVQNAIQYNKVDRIIPVFSGGGSTQLNDGCAPTTTMQQYATAAVLAVKNSKFAPYLKIGAIYPYRNGGLSPATPPPAVVQELMTL